MAKMTMQQARTVCRDLGFSLRRTEWSEFRLAPLGTTPAVAEAQAYYASDLADAIDTARYEAIRRG